MLTIDEIKNISFREAKRGGYMAEDVDAFIDEVIATFEQQKKEKTNLVHKIDRLATRLEEYKEDEETVRNALLTSQRMSDACMKEAKQKAAKIVGDAEEKANAIITEAEAKTAKEKQTYLMLQSDALDLRNELIELYTRHIQTIDDLPTEADVDEARKALEEKYPGVADVAEPEAEAEPVAAEPAPQPEVQPEPKAEPEPQPKAPEETTRVAIKRPGKFKNLKFGENYDVSDDNK